MSNFRSAGSLDDVVLADGDGKFVGMNLRDPLDQLGPGLLGMSKNGRIDGSWEARRGIELKSGALTTSGNPLRLPFFLLNSSIAVSTASRTSNVVTINLASAHGLTVAEVAYLTLGTPGNATEPLPGIAGGSYLMTVTDADSLTFASTGADGALAPDATHGKVWTYLYDDAVERVWGSCIFSDPSSSSAESAILATSAEAKKVALSNYAITSIPYPTGTTVTGRCELLQAFDKIYLFRDGVRTLEWVTKGRAVSTASYVSATGVVSMQVKGHGLTAGDGITVSAVGFSATPTTADPNGAQTVATVVDADNFTYVIATGAGDETYTAGTGLMVPDGFTKVAGGAYTQPQTFLIAGNVYGVSSGLVRVTVSSNSTIKADDFVTVYGTDITGLSALVGKSYQVTSATSTNIYFYAPVEDVTYGSGSGAAYIQIGGRFSVAGGFMHMPSPPWAVYFQRRLWVPFFYDVAGTSTSPTYTDKDQRDQIAASDILDGDTYDQIYSQFRITAGIADYLVGMYPFFNDYLMVLNRNSIHVVKGTQGGLGDTVVHELTREVGCLGRKTIAGQGNKVFFLSDNGVYGLEFQDEYNLRGFQEPLSKSIQPLIDRINAGLAADSVGVYFNNRYFLAVPLDSTAGADDAQGNNSILIYNMLRLVTHVKDLQTLGKSEDEIFKMMRDYGVGSERAIEAFDGIIEDLPAYRPPTTADKYDEIVNRVGKKDVTKEFYAVAKENKALAESLVAHHKRVMRDEKLNVSEREKTLRALDSQDGSRAAFIFREMKRNPDKAQLLKREYIRKGIINENVAQQLSIMEKAAGMNTRRTVTTQQPFTLDSFVPTE